MRLQAPLPGHGPRSRLRAPRRRLVSTLPRCSSRFLDLTEDRIFDVELLLLSSLLRPPVPVEEVPIAWNEVGGSKLSVVRDSAVMALELLVIRLNYGLGVWSVPNTGSR